MQIHSLLRIRIGTLSSAVLAQGSTNLKEPGLTSNCSVAAPTPTFFLVVRTALVPFVPDILMCLEELELGVTMTETELSQCDKHPGIVRRLFENLLEALTGEGLALGIDALGVQGSKRRREIVMSCRDGPRVSPPRLFV